MSWHCGQWHADVSIGLAGKDCRLVVRVFARSLGALWCREQCGRRLGIGISECIVDSPSRCPCSRLVRVHTHRISRLRCPRACCCRWSCSRCVATSLPQYIHQRLVVWTRVTIQWGCWRRLASIRRRGERLVRLHQTHFGIRGVQGEAGRLEWCSSCLVCSGHQDGSVAGIRRLV